MVAGAVITPHHVRPTYIKLRTLDDLIHELGDVPAHRVLMQPLPGTATERDLLRLVEVEKILVEMVNGTLVEKPVGWIEGILGMAIGSAVREFVKKHNLGTVSGADGTLRMRGGNIRLPDVAFVAWTSMPGGKIPREPVPTLPPDLAVEVLSESNTRAEMEIKRREYFGSGARLVWEFDPDARTVAVYTSPDNPQVLDHTKVLDGGHVLPGFTMDLGSLFAELDRSAT